MTTDFRPLADVLRAELAKPMAEDALVEGVSLEDFIAEEKRRDPYIRGFLEGYEYAKESDHDAEMHLNCGHCDPGSDEIECSCIVEKRYQDYKRFVIWEAEQEGNV